MNWVQSYVSSVSFPATLEEARRMEGETDIDLLLGGVEPGSGEGVWWTAPKWVKRGDIVFFYHTKGAKQRVDKLRKEAESTYGSGNGVKQILKKIVRLFDSDAAERRNIFRLLEKAVTQANKYSGSIFGCAEASGSTEYFGEEQVGHFKSRFSVPLSRVHVFERPLTYAELADSVRIGQGATTRLQGTQFESIKRLLVSGNHLPDFLKDAVGAETECPSVDQENWPSISCNENIRFVDEEHLRICLLDFLLKELADTGTPLLRECQCLSHGRRGGIADYFVKIHGHWIPVEAKLNLIAEPKILEQVAQYTDADPFKPRQGAHKGESFQSTGSTVCLVMDQLGVYIISDGRFSGCSVGEPIWRREELNHEVAVPVRDRMKEEREKRIRSG